VVFHFPSWTWCFTCRSLFLYSLDGDRLFRPALHRAVTVITGPEQFGAITAILIFIFFSHSLRPIEVSAIVIITAGIIMLAVIERRADLKLKALTPATKNMSAASRR
jgi:hypothetical protein